MAAAHLLPPCPSPPLRGTASSRRPPGRVTETSRRSPPGRRMCARAGPKGHHRGAARGSDRTRALARGATAPPPSLALVRTPRPRLLRCAARRERRKAWVTDRSRRRIEQHMRAVRPGHGCSVQRWPVRTARRDERRRRRQHEREGRRAMAARRPFGRQWPPPAGARAERGSRGRKERGK